MKQSPFQLPTWVWALILFAAAVVPRALAVGRYVTPDEPNWVFRTLNFGAALARGDWASTVQAGHPGVTTMWLGSLGIALQRVVDPAQTVEAIGWLSKIDYLSSENIEALKRIGVFLDWARLPVIIVNALGVAGVFFLARRLVGQRAAILAGLLLALDPFAAGLGGLLHVDGLVATFSTLAVLSLLAAIDQAKAETRVSKRLARFAITGGLAGLAFLSKSPALFLAPFALFVIVIAAATRRISARHALLGVAVFLMVSAALFVALYPAMWTSPSSALDLMFERATHHATDATRPTFFDGQAELNHGLGFYPQALAFRLSPVTIAGLVLAAFFLIRPSRSRSGSPAHEEPAVHDTRFGIVALLLFSVAFTAFITPAAKKFDRYLMPAIPPLIIVAAWAIDQLTNRLTRQPASLIPAFASTLQALLAVSAAPYLLMSYNPILGGASGARDRIAVGWGEGFGAAAEWIASQHPYATIATGGLSNTAPLYTGRLVTIDDTGLAAADYTIITVSEVQLYPEFFNTLAQQGKLAHTIRIGGIDAAWVYANARAAQQADFIRSAYRADDAIVLDAPTPLARLLDPLPVTVLPGNATPELISNTLDTLRAHSRILYVSTEAAAPLARRDIRAWLTANARPAGEAQVAGAAIRTYSPDRQVTKPLNPFAVQFEGSLALIGLEPLAASTAYPDHISIGARWRVLARPASNYSATLELVDANGDSWGQLGGPLRNAADFAPIDWQPGEVIDQIFSTQAPPALAPGAYRLRFSVERADGTQVGLFSATGAFSGTAPALAAVQIDPGRQPVDPKSISTRQRIGQAWPGQVELIGITLLTYVPATGDHFLAKAYWRSLRDGLDPATEVRWMLEPESGGTRSFEWRTPLVPNVTAPLREGDTVGAAYGQRLPLDLPDGRYRLRLAIGDEAIDVSAIDVVHHDRSFDLPASAVEAGSIGSFDAFLAQPLPAQIQPGESVQVKLAFRAREEVPVNYTVFAHLLDSAGRVVTQVDSWPQGGLWPTINWVREQVVEDQFTLSLPPDAAAGDYRVAIGMYDARDGSHLPARDGSDRLILGAPVRVGAP